MKGASLKRVLKILVMVLIGGATLYLSLRSYAIFYETGALPTVPGRRGSVRWPTEMAPPLGVMFFGSLVCYALILLIGFFCMVVLFVDTQIIKLNEPQRFRLFLYGLIGIAVFGLVLPVVMTL